MSTPQLKDASLGTLCRLVTDGTHDSPKLLSDGVPFIKGKHISSGRIDFSNCDYISVADHQKAIQRSKPQRGDTLFSNIGSVGDTAFVDADREFSIKNVALFKPDPRRVDPRYLFYLLNSPVVQGELVGRRSGSAQPFISLGTLREHVVRYHPDLDTQRRIAGILSAYDDLIENNERRIAILEDMARRVFREWFVDFRFPGHEAVRMVDTEAGRIPEGWQLVGLHDVAEVGFGFPFKSPRFNTTGSGTPIVRIRDVLAGRTETYSDEPFDERYAVNDGDLLVGMDGIFHTAIWSGGEAALNQRVARLRPRWGRSTYWLLLSVLPKIKQLEGSIVGTTVAHLSARDLKEMRILAPTVQVQRAADGLLEPIGAMIATLRHQQQQLAASRDLLLPRLISGDLPVSPAEPLLEAAE